jgi:GT2 family glycosyltransferase
MIRDDQHACVGDDPADLGPIGVIVVNYRSSALVRTNLVAAMPECARPVLVDNFSTSAERESVRALTGASGWELVEMADNPGFGEGVNQGVTRALELGCTSLLFLNPDAVIGPAVVESLRRACLEDPAALVAPRLVDLDGHVVFAGSTLDLVDGRTRGLPKVLAHPDPRSRPVVWLTAACLAMHRDLWLRLDGFASDYFMYWEDVDLNYRAHQLGARIVLRNDLTVVHDQGGTQGPRRGRAKSALYYYYNCRNRMLFASRHLGRRDLLRWLVRTPKVSGEILLRGGRRQLLAQPGLAWSAARGAAAGGRLALRSLVLGSSRRTRVR